MKLELPKIIGHRGACGSAPENTFASIRKAADQGATWIEIDVTATADDQLVIFHDYKLNRCTNGTGLVLTKTLEELTSLDAGSWFSGEFKGERIPTLTEAIKLVKELGLGLNLEIKAAAGWGFPTAQLVADEIDNSWPGDHPLIISSFDTESLHVIHEELPDIPLGILSQPIPYNWQYMLQNLGAYSLHCDWQFLSEEAVQAVQAEGYKLLTYTVNDPGNAQALLDMGVDSVITDFPGLLKSNMAS